MRICDTSSGASTDAVGRCSRQILLLVREKAPDIAALMQYPDKARGSSDSSGKDECGSTSSRKVDTDEAKDDSVGSPDDCTMDDIDEGDTSIRPVDLRAVVTGHVRNRGDDPVPAMDSDDEDSPVPQRGPFHTSASSSALSTLPGHEEATGDFALAGSREEQTTTRDSDFGEGGDGLTHHPLFNENLLTMDEFVHYGVSCDGCGKMPIVGRRHTCVDCGKASCDFDLCGACQDAGYSRPGRFNQNHSADHEVRLVEQSAAEWWIQSLNRMRKIHPELSVHQILQWILMHYQDVWVADNQQGEETAMESGTDIAGNDAVAA
ncbi:hypothetical protein BESB_053440 [Besnoitia besnoiti]|uniref:ZZ-type domain-containing protein n=1 Tax=Besnoitia besnoiti TaxID=94643 RepID=A0A2A9MJ65_BESBE|nr:hypothetical protein BESB_053440 [Besnoitia besnoiti]PFH35693.1 hypothetical protein BESB_053440 [Besnoitia besnoiti]